jgi:hypothetical protein
MVFVSSPSVSNEHMSVGRRTFLEQERGVNEVGPDN